MSSAQSSFTAIIGTVFCVSLFAVALTYVNLSASLVDEQFGRQQTQRLAILLSNDLLMNPGSDNYHGLALYRQTTHSVQEHELDPVKISALAGALEKDQKILNKQWTVDNPLSLRIENLDSGETLLDFGSAGKNAVTVSRLGLAGGGHVFIQLTLSE